MNIIINIIFKNDQKGLQFFLKVKVKKVTINSVFLF